MPYCPGNRQNRQIMEDFQPTLLRKLANPWLSHATPFGSYLPESAAPGSIPMTGYREPHVSFADHNRLTFELNRLPYKCYSPVNANRIDSSFAEGGAESSRRGDSGAAKFDETPRTSSQDIRPHLFRICTRCAQTRFERRWSDGDRRRREETLGGSQGGKDAGCSCR